MPRAKDVYEEVREAQSLLGIGEVAEAARRAVSLRAEAEALLDRPALTSFERIHAAAAFAYSTITLVLAAAESEPPDVSVPKIRELLGDVLGRPQVADDWKVLAAGAEMLARAGDAGGAAWAATKAREIGPEEEHLVRLVGGIRSMYPHAFKGLEEGAPDHPPELPAGWGS